MTAEEKEDEFRTKTALKLAQATISSLQVRVRFLVGTMSFISLLKVLHKEDFRCLLDY